MPEPSREPNLEPRPAVAFSIAPIGLVHMKARHPRRLPRYFAAKGGASLELFHPYSLGLQGLYGGLELWVITYHAPGDGASEDRIRGIFATTTVDRPNPIEFLRARVVEVDPERGHLHVEGLDSEDGAPILDIRPATTSFHRLTRPQPEESRP